MTLKLRSKTMLLALVSTPLLMMSCGDGAVETFYDNDQLKERWYEKELDEGTIVKDGPHEKWDNKGQKRDSIHYVMGKREGFELQWDRHGNKIKECGWSDDQKDGRCEELDPAGFIRKLETWKNGVKNGMFATWNAKKVMTEQSFYVDGKQDSTYQLWNDEGRLLHIQHYKNGLKNGEEKKWCLQEEKKDILAEQRTWINDKREGKEIYHLCLTGELSGILNWKEDKMHGQYISWDGEGKKVIEMFDMGDKMEKKRGRWVKIPKPDSLAQAQ